jgi:hypothetical protein
LCCKRQGSLFEIKDGETAGGYDAADQDGSFKGRHFTGELILWALRWYVAFPISYRDLALMLSDRGVGVDHGTLFRRFRPMLRRLSSGSDDTSGHAPAPGEWTKRTSR